MKIIIFIAVLFLSKVTCDNIKINDNDSNFSNETNKTVKKNLEVNEKLPNNKTSFVYLEDVLFALRNQNWSLEERECFNDTIFLIESLRNFSLWAVWEWDSISSEPVGLLFGNRYQLGNFDECLGAPWSDTHPELKTKYCISDITLESTDKIIKKYANDTFSPYQSALDFIQHRPLYNRPVNELTWGICVPASCQRNSVKRLLYIALARSHLGSAGLRPHISITEECQTRDKEEDIDIGYWAFVITVTILVTVALICTYLNNRKGDRDKPTNGFVGAFCLRSNSKALLKMKKEGSEVVYGIRFLTICWITFGHQMTTTSFGPLSNGLKADKFVLSPLGLVLLHNDLLVDSFFVLSGYLMMCALLRLKNLSNPAILIFKRYLRLMVAYAIVVFYMSFVYPYIGSGPLWPRAIAFDTTPCRKTWWASLLMIGNYIDTENMCIVTSWYIPCDFHFSVVLILLYCAYKKFPKPTLFLIIVITVAAVLSPGIINYCYKLDAVQLFTYEFLKNTRVHRDFHVSYIKSHTRFASYLIGAYFGYYFTYYKENKSGKNIKQRWSTLGTLVSLLVMWAVMLTGGLFVWYQYTPLEGAIYATLNRPVWSIALSVFIFCLSFGHVPIIKNFLSWYPFVPLSRLTYGLYLTHMILIGHNTYIIRNPNENNYFEVLNTASGVIVAGCVASLCLWLFAEAPANNLLNTFLKSRIKQRHTAEDQNETSNSIANSTHENIRRNLPVVVTMSSKI